MAKTDAAHHDLAEQFSSRQVEKVYLTLVEGKLEGAGRIIKPISRDPGNRARMTAKLMGGRAALTEWEVSWQQLRGILLPAHSTGYRAHSPGSGPTWRSLGHPVAGDPLYGAKKTEWDRVTFCTPTGWGSAARSPDEHA